MKISIVLLATALTVVGIPLAAADETHPDCEANQPGIGYRTLSIVWDTAGAKPVCEGEHWDGQDPVSQRDASCDGTVDPANFVVARCLDADPGDSSGSDPLALGVRVTSDGERQVYGASNIPLVGQAVIYVDADGMVAVYLRDNTPENLLATAISAARVTQGYVSEDDCNQATYEAGANSPPSSCGRDNTAITITLP